MDDAPVYFYIHASNKKRFMRNFVKEKSTEI